MNQKTEAVSVVGPGEAALVNYEEYQRIKALAENRPPLPPSDNNGRILYVPCNWARLVNRSLYDRVELLTEDPPPIVADVEI